MSSSSDSADLQSLIRFLTQTARLPLSDALKAIPALRTSNLTSPSTIAASPLSNLTRIFPDPKTARQVLNAAKRVSKPATPNSRKRPAPTDPTHSSKKPRSSTTFPSESSLLAALTPSLLPLTTLTPIRLLTNRAPLLLALAYTVLGSTMPEQPPSSRLSLAAAVVAKNSRSKARSLGIRGHGEKEKQSEEEAGQGFARVRVLGREVEVLRRDRVAAVASESESGNDRGEGEEEEGKDVKSKEVKVEAKAEAKAEGGGEEEVGGDEVPLPLWAVDLAALSSAAPTPLPHRSASSLPIHTPQSALNYLGRSSTFTFSPSSPPPPALENSTLQSPTTPLAVLLQALEALVSSWAGLEPAVLDQRAWGWYVEMRPDVDGGVGGWGQKGVVELGRILGLRKVVKKEEGVGEQGVGVS